jgi:hypothetical protein
VLVSVPSTPLGVSDENGRVILPKRDFGELEFSYPGITPFTIKMDRNDYFRIVVPMWFEHTYFDEAWRILGRNLIEGRGKSARRFRRE